MVDKNEKIFRYIKLRITENFKLTWFGIFQHSANFIIPIILVLCYINRVVAFVATSKESSTNLEFTKVIEKIQKASPAKYDLIADQESLGQVFSEISSKGILTPDYYEGLFNYLIFWHYFSFTIVTLFSLLYYRKFVGK